MSRLILTFLSCDTYAYFWLCGHAGILFPRDIIGAQLVYSGISRVKICGALGVPLDEPGIIEAPQKSA